MARRGRKRRVKLNVRQDTVKSVLSIGLILLGGLILVSFIAPGYSVNAKIKEVVVDLFGYSAILLPIVLILGGLVSTQAVKWKFVDLRVFVGLSALLLILASFFSVVGANGGKVGEGIGGAMEGALSAAGAIIVILLGAI